MRNDDRDTKKRTCPPAQAAQMKRVREIRAACKHKRVVNGQCCECAIDVKGKRK